MKTTKKSQSRVVFATAPASESLAIGSQGEREKRLLLNIVSLCRSGSGAGAGRTLDRQHRAVTSKMPQTRKHIVERSHVGRLFLHPDDFGLGITGKFRREFGLGKWVELF